MKFLVIEQDLRVSGTSQGVISRSFLAKLRKSYPKSVIDVLYLKQTNSDDDLNLLPVDKIETHVVNTKVPFIVKWVNKLYWRLFHVSLNETYIHKCYASHIKKVNYNLYNHIFIRSAGIEHEMILAMHNLPILKKAIVNFHDPYPLPWYVGSNKRVSKIDFFRLKKMIEVVDQAKICSSSAYLMSKDLEHLYVSEKNFYTLPHQYDSDVFDLSDKEHVVKKTKKIAISYHGAIMFGRNADLILDVYKELINENEVYKQQTEFIMRLKSAENPRLRNKYKSTENILILDTLNFSNSSNEQIHETDIAIILENGPLYCNVLVGKAPFLAAYKKPILVLSPKRSELKNYIIDQKYIADMNSKEDIKLKLEHLIINRLSSNEEMFPFGDCFSDRNFKKSLDEILQANVE